MRHLPLFFAAFALTTSLAASGCSEDTPEPFATPGGAGGTLDEPTSPCSDAIDAIYGPTGPLAPDPSARGAILKCAKDPDLTKDQLQAQLIRAGYTGKPPTSGAHVYRVVYRTERGNAKSTPSVSSALVFIPLVPRAAKLPVVVASHGSRGQAPRCAVTKPDPSLSDINDHFFLQVYPLVGSGLAVIAPDLAGYANAPTPENPLSAYAQAVDVGRSTLDGARALKNLFPVLDDKVVLVGHSQGGHTALSALAIAESYGFSTPIVGAAVFAPLWLSQRTYGAVLYNPVGKGYPLATARGIGNVSVWYHYTQAELLDGAGEGEKLFAADKRAAVKSFVETECWDSDALSKIATYADELFDPEFVKQVAFSAVGSEPCEPTATHCQKWLARYSADRPHLTGKALATPIAVVYGGADATIPPGRMKCAWDRLVEDQKDRSKLTMCFESDRTHGNIVASKGSYVADWVASVALGETAPAACAENEAKLPADCATPPPND